jgi:hypothetical protein
MLASVMRLGPQINLLFIATIAEEQHLAAVCDEHERVMGKGHGRFPPLVYQRENAARS